MQVQGEESLSPLFAQQAALMPAVVRSLVVDNAEPGSTHANDVLQALGLPVHRQPSSSSLRSLALLDLLPRPTERDATIRHIPGVLSSEDCELIRAAIDGEPLHFAADSVDGCPDQQVLELHPCPRTHCVPPIADGGAVAHGRQRMLCR